MKKLLFIIGTRPEAIKLAPVIISARQKGMHTYIVSTGQHKDLVEPALDAFGLETNINIELPTSNLPEGLSLGYLTGQLFCNLQPFFNLHAGSSEGVVVQGDTTSAFVGALLGFYFGLKVVHVEAGLRSWEKSQPFPEEVNRKLITQLADYHFCPSVMARDNLLLEGVNPKEMFLVGNTVVDALEMIVDSNYQADYELSSFLKTPYAKLVILTMHRRENWEILPEIAKGLNELFSHYDNVKLLVSLHPNPILRDTFTDIFGENKNVLLADALDYVDFINLLARCYFVITDSGGVQEEAPYLGKPVLVVRRQTERPEGINEGVAKLIGINPATVVNEVKHLLHNDDAHAKMCKKTFNAYGDGKASEMIINTLRGDSSY